MNTTPLIKEVLINVPSDKVWKAITDKDQMKQWYFDLADFRPEVGFEFEFMGGEKDKIFRHLCRITEVDEGKKLTYSWKYDGFEGISYVTFELQDEAGSTRVRLSHAGLESFPTIAEFNKENFVKGWNHIIGTSLKEYLVRSI